MYTDHEICRRIDNNFLPGLHVATFEPGCRHPVQTVPGFARVDNVEAAFRQLAPECICVGQIEVGFLGAPPSMPPCPASTTIVQPTLAVLLVGSRPNIMYTHKVNSQMTTSINIAATFRHFITQNKFFLLRFS